MYEMFLCYSLLFVRVCLIFILVKEITKRYIALVFILDLFLASLNEFYLLFYLLNKKVIPAPTEIYPLLTPIALAHFIMGDGQKRDFGLVLCTDSFTIQEVVSLVNVLIIRYSLICKIREVNKGQYRIYISERSMDKLRAIVLPYMIDTMLYKLNVNSQNK